MMMEFNKKRWNWILEMGMEVICMESEEILRILKSGGNYPVNFKKANQRQLEEITNRVNKILDKIPTRTITETNNLMH